jgi:dTDP-4-dehydrorhamnose 3,5-epimerase
MDVRPTELPGVVVLAPRVFADARGFFAETYHEARYRAAGLDARFVQDNHSRSRRGVVRGLHFQEPEAQGKLVQALRGRVFDVAVDVRRGSPHFGKWTGVELNDDNHWQLWIPPGFAHGFMALSDEADVLYKCTAAYAPECEHTIHWRDPEIAIAWPDAGVEPIVSARDAAAARLSHAKTLPRFEGAS